jgi:Ca2+-binding EF-hand superfamily protein
MFKTTDQNGPIQMKTSLTAALILTALALPAVAQDKEAAIQNFKQADANDDGALTYAEFSTFIDLSAADNIGRAATVKKRSLYSTAFKRLDANGDEVITASELGA